MNKAGGFIALHRQILDWEWYSDTNTFRLFLHILLTANFTEGHFGGRTIQRGQLVTSLTSLASGTSLSVRQVRVSLDHLIMTGEVTSETTNRYRIITVVKYDEYQSRDRQSGRQMTGDTSVKRQADDKQMTGQTSVKRQQYNNNNNINKGTMEQGNNESLRSLPDRFEDFWSAYPRKTDKAGARKAFEKLNPDEELLTDMIIAIGKQKNSQQWLESGGRFIPYPASWLNHRRWEDEVQAATPESVRPASSVKKVIAQQYEQRDYGDEDREAMERMLRMGGF